MSLQLDTLATKRNTLINQIKESSSLQSRRHYAVEVKKLEDEMAEINKLYYDEKNIHSVWIGIPPKGEFDNLRLWAKYNPEYKIHIWTDSTHILTHILGSIIAKNSKQLINSVEEHDYQREADLKDEFYKNYQLNSTKTFDENAKQFLIDKGFASQEEIDNWIDEGNKRNIEEINEIQKYTTSKVILHDVHKEWNEIFPNSQYYEGYLETLEHLHIAAGGSDRIRYAVLDKMGGVYLDTDAMVVFKLDKIRENKEIIDLVNSIKWDETDTSFNRQNKKFEIIINEIIKLHVLNKLDDENLEEFASKWEKIFKGTMDENLEIFKKIAKQFRSMKLNLNVIMPLSNFPINNSLGTIAYERHEHKLYNAFIKSKKNSKLLQTVMEKIEKTDNQLKKMDTYRKLINKNTMVLYHTGPSVLYYTTMELDNHYFFQHTINSDILVGLSNINSFDTSWYNNEKHPESLDTITDIRCAFLEHSKEFKVPNYGDRPEIKTILGKIKNQDLTEEEKIRIWQNPEHWFNSEEFKEVFDETELEELSLLENKQSSVYEKTVENQPGSFSDFPNALENEEEQQIHF